MRTNRPGRAVPIQLRLDGIQNDRRFLVFVNTDGLGPRDERAGIGSDRVAHRGVVEVEDHGPRLFRDRPEQGRLSHGTGALDEHNRVVEHALDGDGKKAAGDETGQLKHRRIVS